MAACRDSPARCQASLLRAQDPVEDVQAQVAQGLNGRRGFPGPGCPVLHQIGHAGLLRVGAGRGVGTHSAAQAQSGRLQEVLTVQGLLQGRSRRLPCRARRFLGRTHYVTGEGDCGVEHRFLAKGRPAPPDGLACPSSSVSDTVSCPLAHQGYSPGSTIAPALRGA